MLTVDDINDVRMLKHTLHVQEGELFANRPAEISQLLQLALAGILDDDQIDSSEDLYLVSLQGAFDLSYDQFLTLARPAFERELANLDARLNASQAVDPGSWEQLAKKRAGLEAIFQLVQRQHRSLGALF
jgi:hypothetical protein